MSAQIERQVNQMLDDIFDMLREAAERVGRIEGYLAAVRGGARQPACLGCRFWERIGPFHNHPEIEAGECRRHAPSAEERWPFVASNEWCGDYEPVRSTEEDAR